MALFLDLSVTHGKFVILDYRSNGFLYFCASNSILSDLYSFHPFVPQPLWVLKSANENCLQRLVHLSSDLARHTGAMLDTSQTGFLKEVLLAYSIFMCFNSNKPSIHPCNYFMTKMIILWFIEFRLDRHQVSLGAYYIILTSLNWFLLQFVLDPCLYYI